MTKVEPNWRSSPDLIAEVKLCEVGARKSPISGDFFSCPLLVDNLAFDCRIILEGQTLELGKCYRVAIKLVQPDVALPHLPEGAGFKLLQGGVSQNFGDGVVIKVCGST